MDIDYNFIPSAESAKRKSQALADYRRFFGEDAPASDNADARYLAAITALLCELKATAEDVRIYERMIEGRDAD